MNKIIYKISGMHCKSCEILIEDKLKELGISGKINVDNQKEIAEIYYLDKEPNDQEIKKALKDMGYVLIGRLSDDKTVSSNQEIITKDKKTYKDLFLAGIIFLTLYMLFGILKLDKVFSVNLSNDSVSWGMAIIVGLTAGVSTCMALVGGLVIGVASKFSEQNSNLSGVQKFKPHIFFNLGRIFGFFILGGILGLVGSAFKISMSLTGFLTILVGIFMLLLGLQLIDIFPFLSKFKITLPKNISRFFGITDSSKKYSNKSTMLLGALTFFLPCGFTQAMQLYAINSGRFFTGGIIMALFALGTAPGLLGIGGLTSFVKGEFSKIFFKIAGLIIIFFAFINFSNGYNLTLVGSGENNSDAKSGASCSLDDSASACGFDNATKDNVADTAETQIIKATFNVRDDMSPTTFRVNVNKPVRFEINASEDGAGCMSTIMIPGVYNKIVPIKKGVFSLTFTPTKTGSYPITCAMGVKRGTLIVQ